MNKLCGSLHLDGLSDYVIKNNLDMGFALDGDKDRVIGVDRKGRVISADYLIYLLAIYYKKNRLLRNNTVVVTKMTNLGIIEKLKDNNINVIYSDVGDKNVLYALEENNLSLGGEA